MSVPSPVPQDTIKIVVVAGNSLKDRNWILRQFPYVVLSYAGSQFRTGSFTNGGKNPRFNKKLKLAVVEGFREIGITAWSKNMFSSDSFIGSGMMDITKVLKDGFDDHTCNLQGANGKSAGDVKLIMHFSNPKKYRRASTPPALNDATETMHVQAYEPSLPLPSIPATGYPPPHPSYQHYPLYPPHSPMHFASTSATRPQSPTPSAPSAPYPSSEELSLPYSSPPPPFQMPAGNDGYNSATKVTKHEEHGPLKEK